MINNRHSPFCIAVSLLWLLSANIILAADSVVLKYNDKNGSCSQDTIPVGGSLRLTPRGIFISSLNTVKEYSSFTSINLTNGRTEITQPSTSGNDTSTDSKTVIDIVLPDPDFKDPEVIGKIESTTTDFTKAIINVNSHYTYTGYTISPDYSVTYNSTTLQEDIDFTTEIVNNINVGTATITFTGKGNYTGTQTKNFEIVAASMENVKVAFSNGTEFTYTGKEIKPKFIITYFGKELTLNSDYTYKYIDNVNAGKAKIIFTGQGNFTGTKEVKFNINPVSIFGAEVTLEKTEFAYTGDSIKPNLSVKLDNNILKDSIDYRVSYEKNVLPGTANVIVTGQGNYEGELKTTFEITNPSTITLMVDSVEVEPSRIQNDGNQAVFDGYYDYTNSFVVNGYNAAIGDTVTLVLRPVEYCEAIVTMNVKYKKQHVKNDIYAYKFARPLDDVVINLHFEVDSVAMGIQSMQVSAIQFCIYDTRGQKLDGGELVNHMDVMDRIKRLPKGLYIIKENNKTFKVYKK